MYLDICLCANSDCPHYGECYRGGAVKRDGIYTVSFLGDDCNEDNGYELFIDAEGECNR